MKTFLKIITWVLGIPLSIILIFVVLGFMAIKFNFWPPTCNVLPLNEAKRVCEFSKLDKAPKGKQAMVTFWVTVPENTSTGDKIILAIDGLEPQTMDKKSETSFQKLITTKTGEILKYKYLHNSDKSFSNAKEYQVKSLDKKIYDHVENWNDTPISLGLNKNIIPAVDMKDTWTINYNMNLFEDTRNNIDSSMTRVKEMGAKEFGVYSFIDMAGGVDDFTVKETESQYYHWRDAAITEKEMKTLEKKAKEYDLKVILHYNVGADYNKYYNVSPIGRFTGGNAGSGVGGDAAEGKAGKDFGRDKPKTKEWLDRYFMQLTPIIVEWGKRAEIAGIDAIDITPQYRPPSAAPLFDYADQKYIEMIKELRKVYHGGIYGTNFAKYGGLTFSPMPKYVNDLDRLTVYVGNINVRHNASVEEMKQAYSVLLNKVEQDFNSYSKPLFLAMTESSYDGTTSGVPAREWGDYKEALAAGYKENWQEQADSYEGFFRALVGRTKFSGIVSGFYWWDDFMAPKYMGTLNNMEGSVRNKPAEAVWKKWFDSFIKK